MSEGRDAGGTTPRRVIGNPSISPCFQSPGCLSKTKRGLRATRASKEATETKGTRHVNRPFKNSLERGYWCLAVMVAYSLAPAPLPAQSNPAADRFQYRIAILGYPSNAAVTWDDKNPMAEYMKSLGAPKVEWSRENLQKLKALGFNTLQLNIAWGYRPNDEPLNLEDVVELPPALRDQYPQPVPLRSQQTPERIQQRRTDLRNRIQMAKEAGFRTIFHFGAPYNAHSRYGDAPPNCLMDGKTPERKI